MNFRCSLPIFFSALAALASVLLSAICIYLLVEERREVEISFLSVPELKVHDKSRRSEMKSNYDLSNEAGVQSFLSELENNRYQYHKLNLEKLLCVALNEIEIFRDRDELQLDRLSYDLTDYLNETFSRSLREEQRNASEIRQNLKMFDLTVLRFLRSRSYYILRNRLCLVLHYFPYSEVFLERLHRSATEYMLVKDSHEVISMKNNTAFNLRLIFNHNNPNLNCSGKQTQAECLQSCFKDKFRLSKYFYNGNETGTVQLPDRVLNDSAHNQVAEHEAACFKKCDKMLCVVTDFLKKNSDDNQYSNSSTNPNKLVKMSYSQFSPLISNFSFYVQITGLTMSFFGVSCYGLALKLIANSFDRNKKAIASVFKLLLWSACLATFIVLLGESLANYRGKKGDRMVKTSVAYPRQPEQISLLLCVPVGLSMGGDTERMTLAQLELGTNDAFNQTVDDVYLEILGEWFPLKWWVNEKKVIFNADDYTSELGRCFLIEFEPGEAKAAYHSIWCELKLVIAFKQLKFEMYILPEGQKFNFNSFRYHPAKSGKFNKIIYKSSPLKCVDYGKEYSTCNSRWNCLDECVLNKSIENNLNTPILRAIDKDLFDPIDWSYLKPDYNLMGNGKLEDDCREEISSPDCYNTFFERDPYGESGSYENTVKIDLYFPILLKSAPDDSSGYDVFLDFLNVETIVFDCNLLKVLTTVVFFLKVKVFELHFVAKKLFQWPVYGLCLAGFALHLVFIIDQVQSSQLVFSNYYEELASRPMPELVFCWSLNKRKMNSIKGFPEQLTGRRLERITSDIRVDTVFKRISYLSSEGGWVQLNLSGVQANETRFQRNGVAFERFYLSGKKCLSIKTGQSYDRARFYFDDTSDGSYEVMHMDFNRSFIENRLVIFFTRTNDSRYLSDIIFLNYSASKHVPVEHARTSYTVAQDDFAGEKPLLISFFLTLDHKEIINNDNFRLIKNPMLIRSERFSNAGQYMADLMERFSSEYGATTLELPLTEPYFDLPINDRLFVEYDHLSHRKKPPKDRKQPENGLIYERKVIENRVKKHLYGSDNPDFKFNMKFSKFQQVFRSKENLGKVFLNLLNAISLWSGFGAPFQLFVFKWCGIGQPIGEMFERSNN